MVFEDKNSWLKVALTVLNDRHPNEQIMKSDSIKKYLLEQKENKFLVPNYKKLSKDPYWIACIYFQQFISHANNLIVHDEITSKLNHEIMYLLKDYLNNNKELQNYLQSSVFNKFFLKLNISDKEKEGLNQTIIFVLMVLIKEELFNQIIDDEDAENKGNYYFILNEIYRVFITTLSDHLENTGSKISLAQIEHVLPSEEEKLRLADSLIKIFFDLQLVTEVILKKKIFNSVKNYRHLKLTPEGKELFSRLKQVDFNFYEKLPMLIPPYLLKKKPKYPLILGTGYNSSTSTGLVLANQGGIIIKPYCGCKISFFSETFLDGLNILSNIPYKLNFILFDEMFSKYPFIEEGEPDSLYYYLKSYLTLKKHKIRHKILHNHFTFLGVLSLNVLTYADRWNKKKNHLCDFSLEKNSKVLLKMITDKQSWFLPAIADTRGRIYSRALISLFTGEIYRSLLLSAEKVEFNHSIGVDIIANYLMSLLGRLHFPSGIVDISNYSWNDKCKLFKTNPSFFLSKSNIPLAKRPYSLAAFLTHLDEIGFHPSNPETTLYQSDYMIPGDCTSSGLQVYSGLLATSLLDNNLGAQTYDSKIQDVYLKTSQLMTSDFSKEQFNTELMPDPNFMRPYIEDFKPTRKFIKRIMMPYFYGITSHKIRNIIKLELFQKSKEDPNLLPKALYNLINKTIIAKNQLNKGPREREELAFAYLQINKILKHLTQYMRHRIDLELTPVMPLFLALRAYASACSNLKVAITWSPAKDIVLTQKYPAIITKEISIKLSNYTRKIKFKNYNHNAQNKLKQDNSFAANFIQSFDAALLRKIVLACNRDEKTRILQGAVHDSFYIRIGEYEKFLSIFKDQFSSLFSEENIKHVIKSFKTPEQIRIEYLKMTGHSKLTKKQKIFLHQYNKSYENLVALLNVSSNIREQFLVNFRKSKYPITL